MPAARGVKRAASKTSASAGSGAPKNKKKRNVVQLEIPTAPKRRGRVLACGLGDVGQLGLGEDVLETTRFKHVTALGDKIVEVRAGGMHTIALDSDGKIWTYGCNDEGALGRHTNGETDEGTPRPIVLPRRAVALSAGDSHSAALLDDGAVFAWGAFRDSHGSMGLVSRGRASAAAREPARLALPEPAAALASGGDHLVILGTSGTVYTLGCGEQGQLGRLSQRSATRDARQGFVSLLTPAKVSLRGPARRVWAGYHATFALDAATHALAAWGLNNYGQLGISGEKRKTAIFSPTECDAFKCGSWSVDDSARWEHVAAGQHHSLAVDSEGRVHAIGRCEYGRLGLGADATDALEPTAIPLLTSKCRAVATGTSNSFAVTEDGQVFAWGMGSEGQLGSGDTNDSPVPAAASLADRPALTVAAGGQHTVVLVESPSSAESPAAGAAEPKENVEPVPEKPKPKGRQAKRQKKDEQEDEVSSTSSAQPADAATDKPQKVNGDEKETPMEVDETDKPQDTKQDDEKPKEKPVEDAKSEDTKSEDTKPETDTSSQDTAASDAEPETKTTDTEAQKPADITDRSAETTEKPVEKVTEVAMVTEIADAKVTDAKTTDVKVTDAKITDAKVPDVKVTDAKVPDVKVTDAKVTDVKGTESKVTDTTDVEMAEVNGTADEAKAIQSEAVAIA